MNSSIDIRLATPDDALTLGAIQAESWRTAFRGIVNDGYLDRDMTDKPGPRLMEPLTQVKKGQAVFMASSKNDALGFAACGPSRDSAQPDRAELYSIYLHPSCVGKGVGTALFNRCRKHLEDAGLSRMFVDVFADNAQARRFYERHGARLVENSLQEVTLHCGQKVMEVRYQWPSPGQ